MMLPLSDLLLSEIPPFLLDMLEVVNSPEPEAPTQNLGKPDDPGFSDLLIINNSAGRCLFRTSEVGINKFVVEPFDAAAAPSFC
jgi:hypothetical protein